MKAQALSGLERSTEVLKEFLYCLALNPECNSVKKKHRRCDFLQMTLCFKSYLQPLCPCRVNLACKINKKHNSQYS